MTLEEMIDRANHSPFVAARVLTSSREANIGAAMLKAEQDRGHRPKMPTMPRDSIGGACAVEAGTLQADIVAFIAANPGVTPGQIVAELGAEQSRVSTALRRLVDIKAIRKTGKPRSPYQTYTATPEKSPPEARKMVSLTDVAKAASARQRADLGGMV